MFEKIPVPSGMRLRLATSRRDLERAKEVDDISFGSHHGVSIDELTEISKIGAVILLLDGKTIVGESQVLLRPTRSLTYKMRPHEAFYHGTAVHPNHQQRGFGALLAQAQEEFAIGNGKAYASLTVRAENYPSIKMRIEQGFTVVEYLSDFYGSVEEDGARLLMRNKFDDVEIDNYFDTTVVPVRFGEAVDKDAHVKIQSAVRSNFHGYAITREAGHQAGLLHFGK